MSSPGRRSPLPHPIRILVADDHIVVQEGVAAIVARQPDMKVVASASDGREAIRLWRKHRPEVTLIDLRMPHVDGFLAIEQIRSICSHARIIVLSSYDTETNISRAVKAGVNGFLVKTTSREELLATIRKVNAGNICLPEPLLVKLASGIRNKNPTDRELDVLQLLAKGMSNREIGIALHISETTVKSHLRKIFHKLNAVSRAEAISIGIRRGLVQL